MTQDNNVCRNALQQVPHMSVCLLANFGKFENKNGKFFAG